MALLDIGHRVLAGVLVVILASCRSTDGLGGARPSLSLKAALAFRSPLRTQAVAADIHHLTFKLVNASDETAVSTVDATPPFASPLTLQLPAPPDGTYRLTVEAFGGTAVTSSLTQGGALLSANAVTVTGLVPTYSTGTAATFPAPLQLKAGGTVQATVTGTGTNRIDVAVLDGVTELTETILSPASFPVGNLPPGTYSLRVRLYDAGNVLQRTEQSTPVTVAGPETGYEADGTFTVAF